MTRWPLVWREVVAERDRTIAALRQAVTVDAERTERVIRALEAGAQRNRDAYNATVARLEGSHERQMVAAEARYAELLARVQTLAPYPPVSGQSLATVAPEPDPVSKVIREQAEGNIPLANHLRRYARQLRQEGFTADQIVGKLVAWQSTEPDEMTS